MNGDNHSSVTVRRQPEFDRGKKKKLTVEISLNPGLLNMGFPQLLYFIILQAHPCCFTI